MDRRNMFKAKGHLGKSTAEATRAKTAQQRAAQRNNMHAAQRNISPELEQPPIDVPVVERMHRVDKLKQWRIEKELKKQREAATKKKPFVTVVKKGVFLDTTNYMDLNKKYRQKIEAKEKSVKKASTNPVTQSQDQSSTSTFFAHVTGEDYLTVETSEVLNRAENASENVCDINMSTEGSAENGESELNSTFEVLTLTGNKQEEIKSVHYGAVPDNNDEASSSHNINQSRKTSIITLTKASSDTVSPEVLIPSRIKQEKIDSVNGCRVPNNNDEASSSNDINRSRKTPTRTSLSTSLNNSSNYLSPFVTVSRGKRSAQKEKNVRESLYKLEVSQPGDLSPTTRRNREAATYFRNQVNSETERLMSTIEIWAEYKDTNSHIDSVYIDQIDVAIGQTNLLITKKFKQFLTLIEQCENGSGEQSVHPKDLEGFWSMVYMQVDNCNERFTKLENLKSDDWIEVGLTPVKVVKQKKPKISKGQGVSASSGIQKMMEAAREKLKKSNRSEGAASNSKDSIYSMPLRETPARRSSMVAQTPKSIIKTPGVRRNAKNVVFAAVEPYSETQSPNVLAIPTPKASLRSRRASTNGVPTPSKHMAQDSPIHRSKHHPHNKPFNPKYHYDRRVFTERPDTDVTKRPYKPYYPRYPSNNPETTDYPRYYPDPPKPRPYTTTTTTTQRPFRRQQHADKPETCNTSYDAITIIRGELFIFKDRYLWRIGNQGLYAGYPHEITRLWTDLPRNFTHVDAVYENKDRQIVFFIGNMYYVFNSNVLANGYPKPLTHLGLPAYLDKIDAALVWGHNNRTYFYSGTLYWRFDEEVKHIELDYPRDMSIWRGIGYHIDAAFQWKNGKTYFFKGKSFWKFDDQIMRVAHDRPLPSASHWMGCERTEHDVESEPTKRSPLTSAHSDGINSKSINSSFSLTFWCCFSVLCLIYGAVSM